MLSGQLPSPFPLAEETLAEVFLREPALPTHSYCGSISLHRRGKSHAGYFGEVTGCMQTELQWMTGVRGSETSKEIVPLVQGREEKGQN